MSPPLEDAIRQYEHITLMALAVVVNDRDSRGVYYWTTGGLRLPLTRGEQLAAAFWLPCNTMPGLPVLTGAVVNMGVAEAHYRNYGELRVRLSCDVCAVALDRALEQRIPTPSPKDG